MNAALHPTPGADAYPVPSGLLQAFMLGSWQRLSRLDVPVFRDPARMAQVHAPRVTVQCMLHALPSRLPRHVLPLREHLAGTVAAAMEPTQALAVLLRHLATPTSHQPDNPYAVHRAVPSPRCLFPCRLVILQREGRTVRLWQHEPDHHAVVDMGATQAMDALLGEHTLAIVGVARFWAAADKYGAFAPYAAMLEAGHLQAQLSHLVRALGWGGQALEGDPAALHAAAPLLEHPLEAVALGWRCSPPQGLLQQVAAGRATAVASIAPSEGLADRFGQLPALAAQFSAVGPAQATPPKPFSPAIAHGAAAGWELLQLMRARSAGNDGPGLAPRLNPLPVGRLSQFAALIRALGHRRGAVPGESQLQLRVLWLDPTVPGAGVYAIDPDGAATPEASATASAQLATLLQSSLPYPGMRLNLSGLKCSALLCADLPAAQAAHGAAALRRLHQAAGAVAQDISLAATALGLFARPVRMLIEPVLEAGATLPGPVIYQVLCGLNRATNTVWEL